MVDNKRKITAIIEGKYDKPPPSPKSGRYGNFGSFEHLFFFLQYACMVTNIQSTCTCTHTHTHSLSLSLSHQDSTQVTKWKTIWVHGYLLSLHLFTLLFRWQVTLLKEKQLQGITVAKYCRLFVTWHWPHMKILFKTKWILRCFVN